MYKDIWSNYNSKIRYSISVLKNDIINNFEFHDVVNQIIKKVDIDFILGDMGLYLQEFLKNTNSSHPEYFLFLKNMIGINCFQEMKEIFEVSNYCKRKKFTHITQNLQFLTHAFKKDNLHYGGKTLGNPCHTHVHTRFLPYDKIWHSRENKKTQKIFLSKVNNFESDRFNNPEVFICYHHNSEKTAELKKELEKRKQIFININCVHMIQEVENAIEKLSCEMLCANFGFRRITLSNIAGIYKKLFPDSNDIYIQPVKENMLDQYADVKLFVNICDYLPAFQSSYAVFDHYGLVGDPSTNQYIMVGERDTQTFFLGYVSHE